jgi:putative PIN family toxin of toxin-antitoxin system
MIRVVLDTNVLVAALKSSTGASYEILRLADLGVFQPVLSVSLITEYEDVLHRAKMEIPLTSAQIDAVIDRICRVSINQRIHFLWRPFLKDPKDDMVFEAALASGAPFIVTFNLKDFQPAGSMGIQAISPRDFLLKL